ncbi:unnamed protein product [Clonostachys chloroleuca]|uniref:Uncharacterized protein n=1 Tax=Clonostachys chloroleuca TaxID=1926264 RepID=A0AA35LPU3_9HYPO|nr:unnamed protein product [Clonostachys chloroleuca]
MESGWYMRTHAQESIRKKSPSGQQPVWFHKVDVEASHAGILVVAAGARVQRSQAVAGILDEDFSRARARLVFAGGGERGCSGFYTPGNCNRRRQKRAVHMSSKESAGQRWMERRIEWAADTGVPSGSGMAGMKRRGGPSWPVLRLSVLEFSVPAVS